MGNSIPSEIKIEFDDSAGVLRDVSQYVLTLGDLSVEQGLEEKHSFGDSWEEWLPFGVGKVNPFDIGGLYDDVATVGPDVLFAITTPDIPSGITRTLKVTWKTTGGTKSTAVECYRRSYTRTPDRNGLTKFKCTVQPTGAVTEV